MPACIIVQLTFVFCFVFVLLDWCHQEKKIVKEKRVREATESEERNGRKEEEEGSRQRQGTSTCAFFS